MTTRTDFLKTAGSAAFLLAAGQSLGDCRRTASSVDFAALQKEIEEVSPQEFLSYLGGEWDWFGLTRKAALQRMDEAFDKVLREVRETVVTDRPAVWLVYNMGIVVKTREACFSVDLKHRKAPEIVPLLDFALITHNHSDHYTEAFYKAMNGAGKTVISNFKDNYGTKDWQKDGGYTRAVRTFSIKDVKIRTSLTDHNSYLVDYTTVFEIRVGDYTIYHSGDCSNEAKLNPTTSPDLWFVHPYNWMDTVHAAARVKPKCTVVAHLNELEHPTGQARWTWKQGLDMQEALVKAGYNAVVPVWGERVA